MTVEGKYVKQLTIQASTECLSEVRHFISDVSKRIGFQKKQIGEIELAVDEACTNIIKHAYQNSGLNSIELTVRDLSDRIQITLRDTGIPFDPKMYKKPNLENRIKNRLRGGVGIYLILNLMDKVEYDVREDGNVTSMYKYKAQNSE
jgi:serine/threonine-protein kinase RsbW